jgi:hypothetical protein
MDGNKSCKMPFLPHSIRTIFCLLTHESHPFYSETRPQMTEDIQTVVDVQQLEGKLLSQPSSPKLIVAGSVDLNDFHVIWEQFQIDPSHHVLRLSA